MWLWDQVCAPLTAVCRSIYLSPRSLPGVLSSLVLFALAITAFTCQPFITTRADDVRVSRSARMAKLMEVNSFPVGWQERQ